MTQPADAKPDVRELIDWSLIRSIMAQGASIQQDYAAGNHPTYEHYSARLDEAARERYEALRSHIEQMESDHADHKTELCELKRINAQYYDELTALRADAERMKKALMDIDHEVRDNDLPLDPEQGRPFGAAVVEANRICDRVADIIDAALAQERNG